MNMMNQAQGSMSFAGQAGAGQDMDNSLLPDNQMAFVRINYRELHTNTNTGTRSLDLELTICENQPYAGRKIWMYMADPFWSQNSEKYNEMGKVHFARILEIGNNAGPNNLAGYDIGAWPDGFQNLNGMVAAVRIGIEKGENGYSDKNKVVEFLSNNPDSASFKMYEALTQGHYNWNEFKKAKKAAGGDAVASQQQAAPQQQQMFGAAQATTPAQQSQMAAPAQQLQQAPATPPAGNQAPDFMGGQAPAQPQQGQPNPAQNAVPPAQATTPQTTGNPPATTAGAFPSNQQGQQAQGQQGFNPNAAPGFIANSNQ